MTKRLGRVFVVLGWIVSCACAAGTDDAKWIATLAERGSASAQVLLAGLYLRGGDGVTRDDRLAAYWFEQAALAGNVYAQRMLAQLYATGRGVPQDSRLAADWSEKAARRGDIVAARELGRMLAAGEGRAKDPRAAAEWLTRAAEAGDAEAQFMLAKMHLAGEGVARDRVKAGDWLARAAAQGYEDALRLLHWIEHLGWETEAELAQGEPSLERLAQDGDLEAAYRLANRLEHGLGTPPDPAKAMAWFRFAAERGHPGAMRALAHILEAGLYGVPRDPAKAAYWKERAEKCVISPATCR